MTTTSTPFPRCCLHHKLRALVERVAEADDSADVLDYAPDLADAARQGAYLLERIAQAFTDGTDSDGWDISIMEEVWTLLVAHGYATDDD